MIARTEVIAAHAEGQLDAYSVLGVKQVKVQAEWLTAGDDLVCPLCADLDGEVMSIDEARGLIPRHPLCRCAWKPVTDKKSDADRIQKSIRSSILKERKKGTSLKEAVSRSTWVGKTKLRR